MPKSAAMKRQMVLNRETVRALTNPHGAAFITTKGPTEVFTYCEIDCGTETANCTVDCSRGC